MKPATILVDCDGVLCDFTGRFVKWAKSRGVDLKPEQITRYNLTSSLVEAGIEKKRASSLVSEFWHLAGYETFCGELEPIDGAREFLERLRELGRVVCVTSPVLSLFWPGERIEWLIRRMGFLGGNIVLAKDKTLIRGDLLIDDSPEHVAAFPWAAVLVWSPYVDDPKHVEDCRHRDRILKPDQTLDETMQIVETNLHRAISVPWSDVGFVGRFERFPALQVGVV